MATQPSGVSSSAGSTRQPIDPDERDPESIASGNRTSADRVSPGNGNGIVDRDESRTRTRTRKKAAPLAAETLAVETQSEVTSETSSGKTRRRRRKAAAAAPDGKAAARGLFEMVELFTISKFGPDGAFSLTERMLIEEPLGRLITKYGSLADQFGGLIDPALVLAGLAIYVVRITALTKPAPAVEQAAQPGIQVTPDMQPDTPLPVADDLIASVLGGAVNR